MSKIEMRRLVIFTVLICGFMFFFVGAQPSQDLAKRVMPKSAPTSPNVASLVESQPEMPTSKVFNERAKEFFKTNLQFMDLAPLNESDKCVLIKTITNDLGALNNISITVIGDNFFLKYYHEKYLGLDSSFVFNKENGQFYFISLPQLDDFRMDTDTYYDEKDDGIYCLKDRTALIKLNTSLLDELFKSDRFIVNLEDEDFFKKFTVASSILSVAFPTLYDQRISVGSFKGKMKEKLERRLLSIPELSDITALVNPMFNEDNYKAHTFFLKEVGYVVLVYSVDYADSKIKVDSYLIPERERRMVFRHADTKYRDCFSKP